MMRSIRKATHMRTIHDIFQRLRAEYLEMPGLRLTPAQVQRLCGVERLMCQPVLDALVAAKFLCANADGTYARLTDGQFSSRPLTAKVVLGLQKPLLKAS